MHTSGGTIMGGWAIFVWFVFVLILGVNIGRGFQFPLEVIGLAISFAIGLTLSVGFWAYWAGRDYTPHR